MADLSRQAYPSALRALHWTVVVLVIVQWVTAGFMEEFFRRAGPDGGFPDTAGAAFHAISGATILVLMLTRGVLRFRLGTPPLPEDTPRALQLFALANHLAFYTLLVLLPLTGVVALYFARGFGDVHEVLKTLLLISIALHVAGVAYHMLVKRDGLLWRMLRVGR